MGLISKVGNKNIALKMQENLYHDTCNVVFIGSFISVTVGHQALQNMNGHFEQRHTLIHP